jgi:hypothetical protein
MEGKKIIWLCIVLITSLNLYAQGTILEDVGSKDLTRLLGAWTLWPEITDRKAREYSWGKGDYIRDGTYVLDIDKDTGILYFEIELGELLRINKIKRLSDTSYEFTISRGDLNPKYWPENGIVIVNVINANEISIDDSSFTILFVQGPGPNTVYRIAGPPDGYL